MATIVKASGSAGDGLGVAAAASNFLDLLNVVLFFLRILSGRGES